MSDLVSEARTKILIAEDDAIVALDLQGMVARMGYDVVAIVDNGNAAVAAAGRFRPDIILLDMQLAGAIDGIEVARKIHETSPIPVIFCISSPDLSALFRAKDISYAGYLLKPINPDSLATTLDTVLYKYKLEKRAELAEERYRRLSETCEILSLFEENDLVFHWTLGNDGVVAWEDGHAPQGDRDSLAEGIAGLVASSFANRVDAAGEGARPRVAGVVSADVVSSGATPVDSGHYVVFGARGSESAIVAGVAVRIEDAAR